MIVVAVLLAGALGAACRFVIDHAVSAGRTGRLPLGTVLVNVSGSFGAGVAAGLAAGQVVPPAAHLVVAGGFLGAYTTFSTAMHDCLRLWEAGARRAALGTLLLPLLLATGAAALGWWLVV